MKRMLHSSIWESEQFISLSDREKLLYFALINFADDDGRFKSDPTRFKIKIFALYSDIDISDIQRMIEKIASTKLISLYVIDGTKYGFHPNWSNYQTIKKDRYKPSDCPSPHSKGSIRWNPLLGVSEGYIEKALEEKHDGDLGAKTEPERSQDGARAEHSRIHNLTQPNLTEPNQRFSKENMTEPSSGIEKKIEKKVGRDEIDWMLGQIKSRIVFGFLSDFKESQKQQRIWGKNLYTLMLKLGQDIFIGRLDVIMKDEFKKLNCSSLAYIYREIKGFVGVKSAVSATSVILEKETRERRERKLREQDSHFEKIESEAKKNPVTKETLERLKAKIFRPMEKTELDTELPEGL